MCLLKTYGVINRFFGFLAVFAAMWVKLENYLTKPGTDVLGK